MVMAEGDSVVGVARSEDLADDEAVDADVVDTELATEVLAEGGLEVVVVAEGEQAVAQPSAGGVVDPDGSGYGEEPEHGAEEGAGGAGES
jgi:hypothetical protein